MCAHNDQSREKAISQLSKHYEKLALHQLKRLEAEMRSHYELTKNEMSCQMNLIGCLVDLSKKYLAGGCPEPEPCCDTLYTYFEPSAYDLLQDYMNKTRLLRSSNTRLMASLDGLRRTKNLFDLYCSKLNMMVESSPVVGEASLGYFTEFMKDCFEYFHAMVLNLSYRPDMMQPSDLNCLEEYKEFLKPSVQFEEYLLKGLAYCQCSLLKPF